MSIIPEEEIQRSSSVNLAPMIDFLFLVIAIFATLAVTRSALFDNDIELVKVRPFEKQSKQQYIINLSIDGQGRYKWITECNEYWMQSISAITQELQQQQTLGLLPKEKEKTKVLLHIDRQSQWDCIARLIFAVKESGFDIHPVYDYAD